MPCVISGFRGEVVENCALRSHYAASSGNLPTFLNNLSVSSSGFKTENRTDGCPETSVRNYHYLMRNDPEERSSKVMPFLMYDKVGYFLQCDERGKGAENFRRTIKMMTMIMMMTTTTMIIIIIIIIMSLLTLSNQSFHK